MTRGFTLIETMLAMVVSSMVLLGALAVLDTLQRADARVEIRARQSESYARAQRTVREALDSLVMEPAGSESPGAPRFRLERRADGLPRLELVLSRPLFDLIDERQRREALEPMATTFQRVVGIDDLPECRGAFEVVPDDFDDTGLLGMVSAGSRPPDEAWLGSGYDGSSDVALIWRRMPPLQLPTGLAFDDRTIPPPVVLARGLRGVRWRVFQNRQRVEQFSATMEDQLPAYVEMDLLGHSGPVASYVFQVGWQRDSDLRELEAPPAAATGADDEPDDDADAETIPGDTERIEIPDELRDELRGFDPSTLESPGGGGGA